MGTGDEDSPEALLAGVGAALADLVVLAAAVLPQEESPFQPPLLAPAHRSCSGGSEVKSSSPRPTTRKVPAMMS